MTLRRHEQQPHLSSFSSSGSTHGSASAFNSPLPSHNGFSTRTRLRPGGPMNHLDNPQFNRAKNGSLPSFEDIGMKTLGIISNKISITTIFGHKRLKQKFGTKFGIFHKKIN